MTLSPIHSPLNNMPVMRPWLLVSVLAAMSCLGGCRTTARQSAISRALPKPAPLPVIEIEGRQSPNYSGLTKQEVVDWLGFPTNAHMISTKAKGGPGFEIWEYYQRSLSGEVEVKDIVFGNSTANLGRVVTSAIGIAPDRIISAENPEGLGQIFQYNSAHGR